MHDAFVLVIPVLPPMVDAAVVPHDHVMLGPLVRVPQVWLGDVLLEELHHLLVFVGIVDTDDFHGEGRNP